MFCHTASRFWPYRVGEAANLTSIFFTPIYTPTHPNIIRLRPIRLDDDPLEIPLRQGILRHDPTPGHPLAYLEQNPAYGTARPFNLQAKSRRPSPGREGEEPDPS
jgi:hypothetical protein